MTCNGTLRDGVLHLTGSSSSVCGVCANPTLCPQDVLTQSPPPADTAPSADDSMDTPFGEEKRPVRKQHSTDSLAPKSLAHSPSTQLPLLNPSQAAVQPLSLDDSLEDTTARPTRTLSKRQLPVADDPIVLTGELSDRAVATDTPSNQRTATVNLPVTIAKAFGGEVFTKLSSGNWKEREEALLQADIVLTSPHLLHPDGALVFEAGM